MTSKLAVIAGLTRKPLQSCPALARLLFTLALALVLSVNIAHAKDDWKTSTPQAQRIDTDALARLQRHLRSDPRVRSVAIVRNGFLTYEYYRERLKEDDLHNVASVTKSVLSAVVGIAIEEKKLGLEASLGELLPEQTARATDPRVKAIRLKHLLTLSAGFDPNSPTTTPAFLGLADFDPVDLVLRRTVVRPPGEAFHYNNVDGHLVSASLGRAVGMSAAKYAEQNLFAGLGITSYTWPADRMGVNIGSGELRLTTRDMAKIGETFLRQGRWNGRQVVPADWVAASTSRQSDGGPPLRRPYGYNWWLGMTPDGAHPVFFAAGFGGQYIYVVPALQLVVVATSELDGEDSTTAKMIREMLMPAVLR